MKTCMRLKLPVLFAVLLPSAPLWAHHGSTGFDQKKPVHFIGKVSLLDWANPHVTIHLDVTGADGKVTTWLVGTLPPNAAIRQGFPKSSFTVGTELTVDGYQATDGSNHVNAASIVFPDGKKIVTPGCFTADGVGPREALYLGWAAGRQCYQPVDGKGIRIE